MLSQKKTAQETTMRIHCTKQFLRAATLLAAIIYGGNILAQPQLAPSCSVTWTGNAGNGVWSTAGNWSPRKVPGPASDVCIPILTTADATATPSISVHSIQVAEGGSLLFGSGKVSIATSLVNQGGITLFGTTLSAGSIDLPAPGGIGSYDNSSITSPAFSNTGTVSVGTGGTLRLADNPVQLENGTLSGGNWLVAGVLIVPSNISQLTSQGTVVDIDGWGSAVQDASGNNALATLTSVGPGTVLALFDGASLTVAQDLTSQGVVDVGSGNGGSLTVRGTYTQASGATTNMGLGSLSATSVSVQAGSTLGGSGTVESSITNNGTVAPQGSLTVAGNYTQTAALTEQFGSTLHVNSNATLAGSLNVTVNPKRPPKSGATYTALTFGSLNGSFTGHTAGFTLTTSANSIQVTKQ
jgi:fibronectin-binding autotransporter adhesin